jgi:putative ABC transport system permease protein
MLALISWRNVWRNKLRSLVLVTSIALGIWVGIFIVSFHQGMSTQYVNIAIKGQVSHLQIHHLEYPKDKKTKYIIPAAQKALKLLENIGTIKAVSARTIVRGMVSSATTGAGITIIGIDPERENLLTDIQKQLVQGDYFLTSKHNQIIIGEKLSKKLNVNISNKIILTFQDVAGNITAGAFRISGIYKTRNSTFDEANVFVQHDELNAHIGLAPEASHEIAILLHNNEELKQTEQQLRSLFIGLLIQNWQEIAPELKFMTDSLSQTMYLFMSIILLALIFGIINTMLMSVLERVHELGILMAIGMNKFKVFSMIMLETLFITLIGGPVGVLLAYGSVSYFGKVGISLSAFATGLSAYGMDSTVYTALERKQYFIILMMVFAAAILAAIYPAIKALKLKPVHAIRKI